MQRRSATPESWCEPMPGVAVLLPLVQLASLMAAECDPKLLEPNTRTGLMVDSLLTAALWQAGEHVK
ncbi:hypothetical protein F183_A10690 [Bryobacterales bacterium F-183]|nr:hypothetical protein F183_A10690 [Bryobacterales bacterium F-183]